MDTTLSSAADATTRRPRSLWEVATWGRELGGIDGFLREFLDTFYLERDRDARAAMLSREPPLSDDDRTNAYLAAVAEHLAFRDEVHGDASGRSGPRLHRRDRGAGHLGDLARIEREWRRLDDDSAGRLAVTDFHTGILAADDVPAFKDLRLEALRDAPEAFGASYEDYLTRPDTFYRQLIGTSPDVVFGAFDGEALIGMAGFVVEKGVKSRHKGFMWGVYVTPPWRGKGVAEALVRQVLGHAARHVEVLRSGVVTTNANAARLYLKLGFETYGLEPGALKLGDRYLDEQLIAIDFRGRTSPDSAEG